MDHLRLTYARTLPLDVLILTCVVLLTVGSTFAWLDFKSRDAEQTRQIADLQTRLAAAESKGASTVHFHFPEAKGTPYVNIDQKGWDMSVPTLKESNDSASVSKKNQRKP